MTKQDKKPQTHIQIHTNCPGPKIKLRMLLMWSNIMLHAPQYATDKLHKQFSTSIFTNIFVVLDSVHDYNWKHKASYGGMILALGLEKPSRSITRLICERLICSSTAQEKKQTPIKHQSSWLTTNAWGTEHKNKTAPIRKKTQTLPTWSHNCAFVKHRWMVKVWMRGRTVFQTNLIRLNLNECSVRSKG